MWVLELSRMKFATCGPPFYLSIAWIILPIFGLHNIYVRLVLIYLTLLIMTLLDSKIKSELEHDTVVFVIHVILSPPRVS